MRKVNIGASIRIVCVNLHRNQSYMSVLIKDTTTMERIQIVKDALEGEYDEFYDDYVAGKKELAEINREYSEQYAGTGEDN